MVAMYRFEISSPLTASADRAWRHATSPAGINAEFRPLLRMTFPGGMSTRAFDKVVLGQPLGRCWMLLFGVLPVDYDDLTLVEIEPGRRFLERSELLTQKCWEHERVVEPANGGCRLTDRVRFEPRVAFLGPLQLVIFRSVFRWRHRNLRRMRFGT
jgi:ligand-binding SRPBCC domain-containing protein